MSKKRWALVSTIGHNLGDSFPVNKVLTFENEQDAIFHAVNLLCENTMEVTREGNGIYGYDGQHWTAAQAIVQWREDHLENEYFHIWEVIEMPTYQDILEEFSGKGCGGCDTPGCTDNEAEGGNG
jgi:hypothetical protein